MAARLIKRVLNEQHRSLEVKEKEEEDNQLQGEESASPESVSRPSINPFDLLNDDDSEPEQENKVTSTNERLRQSDDKEELPSSKYAAVASASNVKSNKKKKNKRIYKSKELDQIIENLSRDANSSTEEHVSTKDRVAKLPFLTKWAASRHNRCLKRTLPLNGPR